MKIGLFFPFCQPEGCTIVWLECGKSNWEERQTWKWNHLYCWRHPIEVVAMTISVVDFSHVSYAQCRVTITKSSESMKIHCWKRLNNAARSSNTKQISKVDNGNLFIFFRMHFNLQRLVYNLKSWPQWPFQIYFFYILCAFWAAFSLLS